jgi:hypothetical protein
LLNTRRERVNTVFKDPVISQLGEVLVLSAKDREVEEISAEGKLDSLL